MNDLDALRKFQDALEERLLTGCEPIHLRRAADALTAIAPDSPHGPMRWGVKPDGTWGYMVMDRPEE